MGLPFFECGRSDDTAVADLIVIVLVQQGANDVIYEFVLAVGDVEGKGAYECDECSQGYLAADLSNSFHYDYPPINMPRCRRTQRWWDPEAPHPGRRTYSC